MINGNTKVMALVIQEMDTITETQKLYLYRLNFTYQDIAQMSLSKKQ